MKKKKILNGTEIGSKTEPATKSSFAPAGAATGFVELDDDALASVSGGVTLDCAVRISRDSINLYTRSGDRLQCRASLTFACDSDTEAASRALHDLERTDVSASDIIDALANAGITALNGDSLTW